MQIRKLRIKVLVEGSAEGEIIFLDSPVSFLGEVDPKKGVVVKSGKEINIKNKIMVFPNSRGSTVGSYVIYALRYYNNSPKAMIVKKAEPILITGCILGEIPLVEIMDENSFTEIKNYHKAIIDSENKLLILTN